MATAVARDAALRSKFEQMAWVTVGETPDIPALQASLLHQFGLTDDDRAAVPAVQLEEKLRRVTRDRRLLLVIDDVWGAEEARALCVLDDASSSACLVTTRISGALPRIEFAPPISLMKRPLFPEDGGPKCETRVQVRSKGSPSSAWGPCPRARRWRCCSRRGKWHTSRTTPHRCARHRRPSWRHLADRASYVSLNCFL